MTRFVVSVSHDNKIGSVAEGLKALGMEINEVHEKDRLIICSGPSISDKLRNVAGVLDVDRA